MLAVLDLQSRKATWLALPEAGGTEKEPRELRWSMPVLSDDGAVAVASVRSSDNKDRWLVRIDPATGKATVLDHLHDDAWVREGFGPGPSSYGWLPESHRLWFTSERTGWMHLYVVDADAGGEARALTSGEWEITDVATSRDRRTFYLTTTEVDPGERHLYAVGVDGGARTRLTTMTGSNEGEISPDGKTIGLIYSAGNRPPEVYRRGVWRHRIGDPRDDEPHRGVDVVSLARSAGDHVSVARRQDPPRAPVHAGDGRREAARLAPGGAVRPRRRLSPERAQVLVVVLPRVHVPSPAGGPRLRRAGRGLPRQCRLRARLAHGDLPPHGRQGPRGHRRRREVPGGRRRRWIRSGSASMAAATAGSSR